jgi:hypothetical protein
MGLRCGARDGRVLCRFRFVGGNRMCGRNLRMMLLDLQRANQARLFAVDKTRNERLADHYLEVAGIAAVAIADDGAISVRRFVTTDRIDGARLVCCASFASALSLARAQYLYGGMSIEDRAMQMGIGVTPHQVVIERALAAVEKVNAAIAEMQQSGGMREVNAAFKAARLADPSLRYQDHLHACKERMLEALAREAGR